ncbi:uncharacterized protein LOC110987705 [Acanthaster planci]|uniref:Uncharacterized protein LOC110987705 n=1 Tax=Acanthaster planci TaxID=133434 RepID=A0A8B7ZMU8_ACAPL|nr:uncharacterized protein LOC110987705 [Acanthaster planci]
MSYGAIFVFIRKRGRRLAAGERPHQGANIISGRCQDNNQPVFPQSPRSPGTPIGGCTSHQPHQSIPIVPSSSPQHLVVLGSHQSIPFVGAARSQSQTDKAANSKLTNQLFTVTSSRLPRPAGEEETPAGCSWELVSSEHLPATPLGAVQSSPLETHQPSADISRLGRHSAIQLAPVLSNTRVSPTWEMLQPPTHSSRDSDGISPSSTERFRDGNQGLRRRQAATQSRITKMLFIATFIFFILWFPWVYLRFYALGSLQKDFKKSSHHANLVAALIVLKDIAYLNSVINAFIYGMANKRFRAECKQLLQNVRQRFS